MVCGRLKQERDYRGILSNAAYELRCHNQSLDLRLRSSARTF